MVLEGLTLGDDPQTWVDLGFAVADDRMTVGGVEVAFGGRGAGEGILGWSVAGLRSEVLPAISVAGIAPEQPHPNGVTAVDHVVAVAGDLDEAIARLGADGLRPRRLRDAGPRRQAFYVLGPALLELVGPAEGVEKPRFWGLTLVASDLEALAQRLGGRLGPVRDAVQPGRRIATLRSEAGSSTAVAFMSPR